MHTIEPVDLSIAAALVLLNAGMSIVLQLGITRALLIAAARMVVQLLLVAAVLGYLFRTVSPLWTTVTALAMVMFAGREISARQERRLRGWWTYGLGTGCMLFATLVVTLLALTTAIRPDPIYDPRYALPLLGMVLGNTMTGISLGIAALTDGLRRDRAAIEARLALGATRWIACRATARAALRLALMPIINSMAATGLIALPGMMTGQILAGADPEQAVLYQMLVMFLIAGGTAIGAVLSVLAWLSRLTDNRHRLRLERLR